MASFFSDDDEDDEEDNADSHSGSDAALVLARADTPDTPPRIRSTRISNASNGSQGTRPDNPVRAPPALKKSGESNRSGSKTVTVFSDEDEEVDEKTKSRVQELVRSNTDLRRQSDALRREVDEWKGKAGSLGGQLDELQEQVEESEQNWSHEQHRRKSEWEDLRGRLEKENSQLQLRLVEWAPMQHEDERSQLLREVLNTVSRTREALQSQGSELLSYSELITEENQKLEDRARAQALCLEQQQSNAERLRAELQQLGGEATELREAEQRAQAAALESEANAQSNAELRCLSEELRSGTSEHADQMRERLGEAEAECEALRRSLEAASDSARLEAQAVDLLLKEKTRCHELECACESLQEELGKSREAEKQGQSHGHWESSCLRLEEELSECRKAELSELRRLEEREGRKLEEMRHGLLDELAESRQRESREFQRLEEVCRRLEEELHAAAETEAGAEAAAHASGAREEERPQEVQARRASGTFAVLARAYAAAAAAASKPPPAAAGARLPGEPRHPRQASAAMEALNWAYAAAARPGDPIADNAPGLARLEDSLRSAGRPPTAVAEAGRWYAKEMAEQRMWAEAEVAESRREVAQLQAELAAQEAANIVVPDRGPELRLRELEARCEASAEEVRRVRGLLAERQAESCPRPPAEEVCTRPSEARLAAALKRRQACRAWNSSLKAAHVEVVLPMRLGAGSLSSAQQERLQEVLARALSSCDVEPSDVEVRPLQDSLRCAVHIRGCRTVRAVSEALARMLETPEGSGSLLAIFAGEGALQGSMQVAPRWPFERLQAELWFDYGYMLTTSQLEKLAPVVAESCALYDRACEHARAKSPYELEALECWWSKASYEGDLLPMEEGERRRLLEDIIEQGAFRLADLMEDAGKAQLDLKAALAPNTSWARSALGDLEKVPPGHAHRSWQSGKGDPAPNAVHYDPGLEAEKLLLEEARCRMLPLDEHPRVRRLLGVSRLDIRFESLECLLRGMDWISSHLDVLWIHNGFWNPPCLGYRDVSMGVRQLVPADVSSGTPQRSHVSELRLSLKELREVQQGEGRRLYEHLGSVLLHCGVQQKDVAGVRRTVLRALDSTDGRIAQEAMQDLRCILSVLEVHADSMTEAAALLAGELRREARAQATAAGVSQEQIAHIEALVAATVRRPEARQEVRRRPQEAVAQPPRPCESCKAEVGGLQRRCDELEGALTSREAENEFLKAEVERLTLQAEAAAQAPAAPRGEELRAARSELAEAQAMGRRLQESEAARAKQLRAAEARASALAEELKQSQAAPTRAASGRKPDPAATKPGQALELILPSTLEPCVEDPYTPAPTYSKQPVDPTSPNKSASERRRLASLAHNSAAAVARLLKEVRGLNDARVVLAVGQDAPSAASRLSAVKELERQTCQLERTNHEWASVVAHRNSSGGRPGDASGGDSGVGAGPKDGAKDGLSPLERGAALTSALQNTARRLESLHGRLKDFEPVEQDVRRS